MSNKALYLHQRQCTRPLSFGHRLITSDSSIAQLSSDSRGDNYEVCVLGRFASPPDIEDYGNYAPTSAHVQ